MRLNLTSPEEVTLTGTSPCFKGTAFEGESFKIAVRPMTKSDRSRLFKKLTTVTDGKPKIDMSQLDTETFCEVVKSWDNIHGPDGKPLTCDDETKRMVAEYCPTMLEAILGEIHPDEVIKDVPEDEEKN